MAEETPRTLNHFGLFSFTADYWRLPAGERHALLGRWLAGLREAAETVHCYQTWPLQAGADLVVWSAVHAEKTTVATEFFSRYAAASAGFRAQVTLRDTLWGFTKPSQYTKTRSTQELDPFVGQRLPYLIMYPFVKTTDWYLKSREDRQAMMMEHIKVGKQYPEITQLLLYSFGLQDQEFVVVYETEDLTHFLDLVNELRSTEARRYTQRDYPLHTGLYQADDAALARWL